MESIETGRHWSDIALSEGHDVTAAASEAQDAKIDLFSASVSFSSARTSRGWSWTDPG
jgi:hypothetical protein